MSAESDAIDAAVLSLLSGPKKVTTDGMSVEQQSLADLLAARASLLTTTTPTGVRRGVYFTRLIPGGTE